MRYNTIHTNNSNGNTANQTMPHREPIAVSIISDNTKTSPINCKALAIIPCLSNSSKILNVILPFSIFKDFS